TRPEEKTSTSAKGLYSTFGLNQRGFQRLGNHEVGETALDFPDHIANPNHACLNDLRVDAAQMKLFPQRRIDELHRIHPKTRDELFAARVRLSRDFDDGRAEHEACPGGQILRAQIHVYVKLIASQLPALFSLRYESGHAGVHDIKLRVWMRQPVCCVRT